MKYVIACFLMMLAYVSYSQAWNEHDEKELISIYADSAAATEFSGSNTNNSMLRIDTAGYYLVKIFQQKDSVFRIQFQRNIARRFNGNWYVLNIPDTSVLYTPGSFFEAIMPANNNWKLSPKLINRKDQTDSKAVFKFLIKVTDINIFRSFINENRSEATILYANNDARLCVILSNIRFILQNILPLNVVLNIDIRDMTPKAETVLNDYDNTVNKINLLHAALPGINANGITVSVKEDMFDTTDIDLTGRVKTTTLSSPVISEHATVMATIIGGGGNSFFSGKGAAWGALITSSDFAVLMPDSDAAYRQYNISVQNHSYGVGIENYYGSDAGAYDSSMITNASLLHIFSAGNVGNTASGSGQYSGIAGFANITGSFKMSKNTMSIGGIDTFYHITALSSRGPAYDGRVKPELVAYGNEGTSDAAATISGIALILQDAYRKKHNDSLPANALVKAMLINSADDIGAKGIDFSSGYGNANAFKAAGDMQLENYFTGNVQQGETKNFALTIPANAANLKITLVWDDVPAQTNAPVALVNDLDLSLQNIYTNETWQPCVLNSYPNADSLAQLPLRKRDTLNVVEQVTLDSPAQGNYLIKIRGYDVPGGTQSFYTVFRWDTLNSFKFTSPAKNDHFTSGVQNIFRWENNYAAAKGKLEYSINDGNTWRLVDSSADLSKNYYVWNTPDTFAIAIARMTISNDVYLSDTFNFSKQLYPEVGFNCTDTFQIYWNKAPPLDHYQLYSLGNKYLEPVNVYTDTGIVLHKATNPSLYYAVAPLFSNGTAGVNSYTFNYTTQGVGCYMEDFLADLQNNNSVLLTLDLGSLYGVSKIIFQKRTQNDWSDLQTLQPVASLQSFYTDHDLAPVNIYRAMILLSSGAIITSDELIVYYFSQNQFVLLPNPVLRSQGLTVLSNDPSNAVLVIYDMLGKKVVQRSLTDTQQTVPVGSLAKGIYFVLIWKDGNKVFSKKIVVQ